MGDLSPLAAAAATATTSTTAAAATPPHHPRVQIHFEEVPLWEEFNLVTNEMIVSKPGRMMFPVIKARISGLEPNALYTVLLAFKQVGDNRWKYVNGEWKSGGAAEPAPPDPIYRHPSSPNYGANWTKETVVFDNIKLSNKTSSSASGEGKKIVLNSLHRYEPRVHVIKFSDPGREEGNVKRVEWDFVQSFPPARFITVTAYQNEDVTGLKVKYNRYAKGKSKNDKAKEAVPVADVNARDRITYKKRSFALDQFHDVRVNTDPNLNQNSQPSVPNGNQLAQTPSIGSIATTNNSSTNLAPQSSSASSTRNPLNPIVPSLPQQPLKPRAPLGWDIAKPDPEQEPEPVSGL